jgi:hypothetical protein
VQDQPRRAKARRERLRFLLLLWTLEAGIVSRDTLRDRAVAELEYRWPTLSKGERAAFNNQLSRDIRALVEADLIEAIHLHPDGTVEEYIEGSEHRMRKQVYFRAIVEPDYVVVSPGGPERDPQGPHLAHKMREWLPGSAVPPRGRAELAFALADMRASVGAGGPGRMLLDRMMAAIEVRFGRSERMPPVRYRPLPPALGEHGKAKVRPHVWDAVVRAMDRGVRISLHHNGRKRAEAQRLCPYRIVWYNGRPRLEYYWFDLGLRRWAAVPLHFLANVEVHEMDRIEAAGERPPAAEREMLDNVWGADLEDKAFADRPEADRRTLVEVAEDFELVFRDGAARRSGPAPRAAEGSGHDVPVPPLPSAPRRGMPRAGAARTNGEVGDDAIRCLGRA